MKQQERMFSAKDNKLPVEVSVFQNSNAFEIWLAMTYYMTKEGKGFRNGN